MNAAAWTKTRKKWPGIWRHESGWEVRHCGHPTALWPYAAYGPEDEMLICWNRKAFHLLVDAQEAVERLVAGTMTPVKQEGYLVAVRPDGWKLRGR